MKLRAIAIDFLWLSMALVACSSGRESISERSGVGLAVNAVTATVTTESGSTSGIAIAKKTATATIVGGSDTDSPALWTLHGELIYGDEYGVTSFEIQDSAFKVGSDGELDGAGLAVFEHEGPCLGARDEYGFEISGQYDKDTNMFIIDDSFTFNEDQDAEDPDDIITYDNTMAGCTVGQTLGESISLFRPIIFLAAEGGNENIQAGEIRIPAISNETVVLNINGGQEGIESTGMGGYVFFEVVQIGD